MKKFLKFLATNLIATIFAASILTSCAQKGIGNFPELKWGMTPEQVAKYYEITCMDSYGQGGLADDGIGPEPDYEENEYTDEEVDDPNFFAPEVDYTGDEDPKLTLQLERMEAVSNYVSGDMDNMVFFTFYNNKLFQVEQAYSKPVECPAKTLDYFSKDQLSCYEYFQDWSPFDAETESVFTQLTNKNGTLSLIDGQIVSEKHFDFNTFTFVHPAINLEQEQENCSWTTEKITDTKTGYKYITLTSKKSESGHAVFIGIKMGSNPEDSLIKAGIIASNKNFYVEPPIPYTFMNWTSNTFELPETSIKIYTNEGTSDQFSADKYIIRQCLENEFITLMNSQTEDVETEIEVAGLLKALRNTGIDLITISNLCRIAFG